MPLSLSRVLEAQPSAGTKPLQCLAMGLAGEPRAAWPWPVGAPSGPPSPALQCAAPDPKLVELQSAIWKVIQIDGVAIFCVRKREQKKREKHWDSNRFHKEREQLFKLY